jgi:alpha-tubulin suppressor-like RCC1 family protein
MSQTTVWIHGSNEAQQSGFDFFASQGQEKFMYDEDLEERMNIVLLPTPIDRFSTPLNVLWIACGGQHTLAVLSNGDLYSWGCNDERALGHNAEVPERVDLPGCVT